MQYHFVDDLLVYDKSVTEWITKDWVDVAYKS